MSSRAACPHRKLLLADKGYCLLPPVVVPAVAAAPSTSPRLWALFVLSMAQTIAQSLSVDGCDLKREIHLSASSHRPQGHRSSQAGWSWGAGRKKSSPMTIACGPDQAHRDPPGGKGIAQLDALG